MDQTDEKKPPVGGVDYMLLGYRNSARGHLLRALGAFESAAHACNCVKLHHAGIEINGFIEQEVHRLIARVLPLIELEPSSQPLVAVASGCYQTAVPPAPTPEH